MRRSPHTFLVKPSLLALKEPLDACDGRVDDGNSGGSPGEIPVGCAGSALCAGVGGVGAVVSSCGPVHCRKCKNQRLCQ